MEKGKTQRFPNGQERENNKLRERNQRAMRRKIFSGLRVHGNYNLPKHSDTLDLLMALCEEAGWHVEKYGTIYRKDADTSFVGLQGSSSSINQANRL